MLNEPTNTKNTFKVTVHMVSSLDGIIAKKDNSVSWLETSDYYEKGVEVTEQDREEFLKTIDCYAMGSRTYEHALELSKLYGWAYGDVPTIVLTQRKLAINSPNMEIYSGDLTNLVNERLKPRYKNVWGCGRSYCCQRIYSIKIGGRNYVISYAHYFGGTEHCFLTI